MKFELKKRISEWYNLTYSNITESILGEINLPILSWTNKFLKGLQSSSIILDGGCGTGKISINCGKKHRIICVDISMNEIRIAHTAAKKMKLANLDFVLADLENLPFRAQIFSFAYFWGTFEYISNPLDIFKEIKRTLQSKGKFIFNVYNRGGFFYFISRLKIFRKLFNSYFRPTDISNLIFAFNKTEIRKNLKALDFKINKLYGGNLRETLILFTNYSLLLKKIKKIILIFAKFIEISFLGSYICSTLLIVAEKKVFK